MILRNWIELMILIAVIITGAIIKYKTKKMSRMWMALTV